MRSSFQIFLSSTSSDLERHRLRVAEAIGRLEQRTVRMESFGARPGTPLRECRELAAKADATVALVAHRYGWVPDESAGGDGKTSITRYEVETALAAGQPVFAFLVDPQAPWTHEREQDRLVDARTPEEAEAVRRALRALADFKKFLQSRVVCETFSTPDDLALKVATSLFPWLVENLTPAPPGLDEPVLSAASARRGRPITGGELLRLHLAGAGAVAAASRLLEETGATVAEWRLTNGDSCELRVRLPETIDRNALIRRLEDLEDVRSARF